MNILEYANEGWHVEPLNAPCAAAMNNPEYQDPGLANIDTSEPEGDTTVMVDCASIFHMARVSLEYTCAACFMDNGAWVLTSHGRFPAVPLRRPRIGCPTRAGESAASERLPTAAQRRTGSLWQLRQTSPGGWTGIQQ